jgi:hypothetical protein
MVIQGGEDIHVADSNLKCIITAVEEEASCR